MRDQLFDEEFLKKLERINIVTHRAASGMLQGDRRSRKRGQSVEFADFRPYVSGDDFRRIDWNAYARLERFFIKLFVDEQDITVHFVIDTSLSMDWGNPNKLNFAIRSVGALGYITLLNLDRVTVINYPPSRDSNLPALRGRNRSAGLFKYLGAIRAGGGDEQNRGPARLMRAYAAESKLAGPLVLLSDLMDDGWKEAISILASRGFEISIMHILSSEEINPDYIGDLNLIDVENETGVEITADFETLERYRKSLAEWREGWKRYCSARTINYIPLDSSTPLEDMLFVWLRKAGVVR